MRIQNILDTYKHLPANSIRCVDGGMVIKSENCVIRIIPNLKREIMTQIGDGYQTGFSFYENSSLAEFHQNTMKIPFNANDFGFLKQHNSKQKISKNTIPPKNKIQKKSKKQKDMRIDINDRFKDFLKDLPLNSHLDNVFATIYMNIRMMCKEPLIMYSHFFQKDFFSNKPKARVVSETEMTELQNKKKNKKQINSF